MKTRIAALGIGLTLFLAGVVTGQRPKENISPARHPNLAAAQQLSRQAWEKILAAQRANEWDLDGHAQKAKNLLDEVSQELRLAANASNRNGH